MDSADAVRDRLARAVSAWMDRTGLSPTDLHKRTGISRDAFYRLREGKGFPALDTLVAFASAVGTTAPALLDGALPTADAVSLDAKRASRSARVPAGYLDPSGERAFTPQNVFERIEEVESLLGTRSEGLRVIGGDRTPVSARLRGLETGVDTTRAELAETNARLERAQSRIEALEAAQRRRGKRGGPS